MEHAPTVARVLPLKELLDGVEATTFALLGKRETLSNYKKEPYYRCTFADRGFGLVSMIWLNSPHFEAAGSWVEGDAFRIVARGNLHKQYGLQMELVEIRRADEELDGLDGYRYCDLVEGAKYTQTDLTESLFAHLRKMKNRALANLVSRILEDHREVLGRMPAASKMHHPFPGGLLEHVWSVTRIAARLAEHYAVYYDDLDPPLNKDVVVAAAILHDIGKLLELQAHPVEARYTTAGSLIGHIALGRDMVRDTARMLGEIDSETMLLLDHAILSHHGRKEFGSPVEPQTVEALILSYADELDAKLNAVVRARKHASNGADTFTDKVFAFDKGRRFYKGVPKPPADDEAADAGAGDSRNGA